MDSTKSNLFYFIILYIRKEVWKLIFIDSILNKKKNTQGYACPEEPIA
jgi:hypothetical protein